MSFSQKLRVEEAPDECATWSIDGRSTLGIGPAVQTFKSISCNFALSAGLANGHSYSLQYFRRSRPNFRFPYFDLRYCNKRYMVPYGLALYL